MQEKRSHEEPLASGAPSLHLERKAMGSSQPRESSPFSYWVKVELIFFSLFVLVVPLIIVSVAD